MGRECAKADSSAICRPSPCRKVGPELPNLRRLAVNNADMPSSESKKKPWPFGCMFLLRVPFVMFQRENNKKHPTFWMSNMRQTHVRIQETCSNANAALRSFEQAFWHSPPLPLEQQAHSDAIKTFRNESEAGMFLHGVCPSFEVDRKSSLLDVAESCPLPRLDDEKAL